MIRRQRKVGIEITDIVDTDDRCIKVRVKETGKTACLPRFITEFKIGMAFVPEWLAAKICPAPAGGVQEKRKAGCRTGAGQ